MMLFWLTQRNATVVQGGGVSLAVQVVESVLLAVSGVLGVTLGVAGPEAVRLIVPEGGGGLTVDLLDIDLNVDC